MDPKRRLRSHDEDSVRPVRPSGATNPFAAPELGQLYD